jgi:hypothetical protein
VSGQSVVAHEQPLRRFRLQLFQRLQRSILCSHSPLFTGLCAAPAHFRGDLPCSKPSYRQTPCRARPDLIDVTASSEDAEESKPAPDIFEIVIKKLKNEGGDAVAIGDTPYDASAAGKAGIATIGVLCGGFTEAALREAGCADVYPGPAALFARFEKSLLAR